MGNYKSKIGWKIVAMIGIFGINISAFTKDTTDLMSLSLEDILNMQVTTASKSSETQSDAPGIITVLSQDELARFGGTTLRDVLERVPGLIASGANYTNRTTIAPRGDQIKQNSSHVLFLINGRPVREVQEGGVSSDVLETFPINVIEKIEVIKGPGSVLYGSDAFSAVINVVTKKAERNGITVTQLAGDGGALVSSGTVTVQKGDLGIVAAGRYLKKADWKPDYKYNVTSYTQIDSVTWIPVSSSAVQTMDIVNKGPGAFFSVNYKGLSLQSAYDEWTTAYIQGGTPGNTRLRKSFNNLGYNFAVSEKWLMDLNVTYTYSNMYGPVISKRASHNLVGELTNSINLGEKTKLVVGGLFNQNKGKERTFPTEASAFGPAAPERVISEGTLNSYALYAQVDYRLLESLKLIGGLQAIKPEKIDLQVVPRAGAIWYPMPRFSVKALYSEAFRAASINETRMDYMGLLLGNADLKPEKVATFDLGLSYQGEQAQIGINLFSSKMTDIVQIVYSGGWTGLYSNVGEVTFMGAEFEGKYYVNRSLYITGSVLYQKNEDADNNKNVTPVANVGTKAGVSYAWDKGVTISLFDIYQGKLDSRFTQNINPNQGSYNLLHLNGKFNLNKLFGMKIGQDFSLLFQVDNVLDKPHFGYDLGGVSGDAIPNIPGRAIYAGLSISM